MRKLARTFSRKACSLLTWNFTKFVVDRDGNVVARFEPTADMKDLEECVKSLL
jgi:glutathione peroxidase